MTGPIRGQVAKVLSTRELIINRGAVHGVVVGNRFAVLDPKAENVKDPETGDNLGSIAKPKVNVEVTRVEPRMSIAATYKKRRVNIGGVGVSGMSTLGRLFEPPQYVDQYDTFKTSDQSWEELSEAESYVKVGDPVVLLSPREEELGVRTQTGSAGGQIAKPRARRAAAKPQMESGVEGSAKT